MFYSLSITPWNVLEHQLGQKLKPSTGETTAIVNKTFIGMIMRSCIMKGLAEVDPTYAVKGVIKRQKLIMPDRYR